jgi:hypothetical protein
VLGTVAGWMAAQGLADGWVAWSGQWVGQAGGPVIAILWLGALAAIRRFAA